MSYTEADLASVQQAILDLAKGARIVRATIGGDTFEYGQVDLDKLKVLRSEIKVELREKAGTPGFVRVQTGKGL